MRIEDPDGNVLASYSYDAWGKAYKSSGSMRNINPLRFRGYYYDTETGFYYLQSRYYDPVVSRFINADSYASTGQGFLGYNMFAYCGNNPVSRVDADGNKYTMITDFGGGRRTNAKTEYGLTISKGSQVSLNVGAWSFSGSIGWSVDLKGNVELQGNFSGVASTGGSLSASIGKYEFISNAPSVDYLPGDSYLFGGSLSVPVAPPICITGGGDINVIPVPYSSDYYLGGTKFLGVGVGAGVELHAGMERTESSFGKKFRFNIFDIVRDIIF